MRVVGHDNVAPLKDHLFSRREVSLLSLVDTQGVSPSGLIDVSAFKSSGKIAERNFERTKNSSKNLLTRAGGCAIIQRLKQMNENSEDT
jgi:hypothetical protein